MDVGNINVKFDVNNLDFAVPNIEFDVPNIKFDVPNIDLCLIEKYSYIIIQKTKLRCFESIIQTCS